MSQSAAWTGPSAKELVALCRERDVPAFHVQGAADLRPEWFTGYATVGLTAGTSTLDETIHEVERSLMSIPTENPKPSRNRVGEDDAGRTSAEWVDYFRHNARSLLDVPWEHGAELTDTEKMIVASSLPVFQLGESSEGLHMLRLAQDHAATNGDPAYVDAVKLFIREEQRHARDLGRYLDMAGIPRLQKAFSDGVFRWLRHRANLELTTIVVLVAELIAMVYYHALCRATRSTVLQRLCEQILRDEVAHIRFQCERLQKLRHRRSRLVHCCVTLFHRFLYAGTCLIVWRKHRRVLRAGGFGFLQFWRAAWREMRRAFDWMIVKSPDERQPITLPKAIQLSQATH